MKLSVIIPTYNRAAYLGEAIRSVLNQRGVKTDYEVIVVDDGSTDDTQKILEKYKGKIKVIKLKHSGKPAVARNAGLKAAKGELIAFQDSDDVWTADKLSKQLPVFDNPKVILSYANNGFIDKDSKILARKRGVARSIPINGYAFMSLISKQPSTIPAPTVIIKKTAIAKVGPFNEKLTIATDTDYWIRLSTVGDFSYTDEVLAYMRRDGSNISKIPSEAGDEAVYTHEKNRLNMYKQLDKELKLGKQEKEALNYRIAELGLEVNEPNKPLPGKKPKLPPKPESLVEIDKRYEHTFVGAADKGIRYLFFWSPKTYYFVKRFLKKLIYPIRRSI